jgi:Zn-finger nucleic acid-binding protein
MMRDDHAMCPNCGRGLDPNGRRLVCGACAGVMVPEDELRTMVAEMLVGAAKAQEGPPELPYEPVELTDRSKTCARCPATMTKHRLYGMLIDRCEAHGVWFDDTELQSALANASASVSRLSTHEKVVMATIGGGSIAFYIATTILRLISGSG